METMMDITTELDDKAMILMSALAEGLADHDEAIFEYEPLARIEPIETEARDGFWPWTQGGYKVCLPASLRSAQVSGSAPAPIQSLIDSSVKDAEEEWDRANPEFPIAVLYGGCDGGPLYERIRELWYEHADMWFNGSDDCYFWKARIIYYAADNRHNDLDVDSVYIDAYLVTDSYGRDSIPWLAAYPGGKADQTSGDFKRSIPMAEFVAMSDEAVLELAKEALSQLP